jgi:hypothetical protein
VWASMNSNVELIIGRHNIFALVMTILRALLFEPFEVFRWHTVIYCWLLRGSLGYIPMEIRD